MCQAGLISKNVVRLSRRSYNHGLEVATPNSYHVSQLAKLNNDLDALYELVYSQWDTITEEDYKVFGGQIAILLQTLKQLYQSCRKHPNRAELSKETKRLEMNYSALYELNSDIINFRIKLPHNQEIKSLLNRLSEVATPKTVHCSSWT